MRRLIFAGLIVTLILVSSCSSREDENTAKAKKLIDYNKKKFDNLPLSGKLANGIREIEVKAFQYGWEPENIVAKKGEKIRLIITSEDAPHGFELEGVQIPGWDVDKTVKKGDKVVLEVDAAEAGTWDMVCTVYCGPGHLGMRGKYIVKEK